ncbi:MAG: hypothetical protein AABW41_03955 [Nanoarchaeota archaeon]
MEVKQISLTIPKSLLEASESYYKEFGYRNIQEFILDIMRRQVMLENIERYKAIEERMKKGIKVKKFNQKDAVKYIKNL